MSLKLGGSKSKTTSSSNRTASSTTTSILPEWGTAPVQGAANQIGSLLGRTYVAPIQALQGRAAAGAVNLGDTGWLAPHINAATPFASGGKAYNWMNEYENRYVDQVVDASGKDLDANAGWVRAQQALDLAGAGAFGGSGAALTQSMTEGELARSRASTLSGLRSRAFEQALAAAAGDADRATQARIANAQMALQDRAQKVGYGFQAEANQRDNIAAQAQLGAMLRDVDQQQRQAPITNTQQIVAMLNGLPLGLFAGQQRNETENTTGTSKTKGSEWGFSYNPEENARAVASAIVGGGG